MARLTYSIPIRIDPRWHHSNRNRLGDLQKQSTKSDLFKTLPGPIKDKEKKREREKEREREGRKDHKIEVSAPM